MGPSLPNRSFMLVFLYWLSSTLFDSLLPLERNRVSNAIACMCDRIVQCALGQCGEVSVEELVVRVDERDRQALQRVARTCTDRHRHRHSDDGDGDDDGEMGG